MTATTQPTWKLVGTIGDINPIDHDGGFVYIDTTDRYTAELEWIESQDDGSAVDAGPWKVYRWTLDRCERVTSGGEVYLVPFGFGSRTDLPHPIASYDEWFNSDLASVAQSMDRDVSDLREYFCSDNPLVRAMAYLDLAQYHGMENFDSYPLHFTDRTEMEARYERKNTEAN